MATLLAHVKMVQFRMYSVEPGSEICRPKLLLGNTWKRIII